MMIRGLAGVVLTLASYVKEVLPQLRVRPAEVRPFNEVRGRLKLEQPYYLAKADAEYVLIPKDEYLERVEALLNQISGPEA